uniref:Uncharacterized protein n=1 Tax=Ananas comosus var. bracteatus TaxID=296719 RepID=A0A6V7Q1X0_ANACO|nr:unnamed protein product [Ananas comosus var. bracteatus]
MPADLLVVGQLQDFDVVLGMDWLALYYATIDCGARTVTFRKPGQEEFTFRGCRSTLFATWISSARAQQMLSSGCIAFLATGSVGAFVADVAPRSRSRIQLPALHRKEDERVRIFAVCDVAPVLVAVEVSLVETLLFSTTVYLD